MVSFAERNGLTDETLEKMNEAWKNNVNKDYMHNVYDHIKKSKIIVLLHGGHIVPHATKK